MKKRMERMMEMKAKSRRFLALLLAMLLVFGLSTSAFAAENTSGDTEAIPALSEQSEPAEEDTIPTEELTEPEETAETEETAPMPDKDETIAEEAETHPEETETSGEAAESDEPEAAVPEVPEETAPTDQVENLQEETAFIAVPLSASQGGIPDEMWDNSILRALAYTGYNVQKLKDNGWLYRYEYIGSRLLRTAPDILSNIGYNPVPNGDETVADASTPTGRAPDISYFERNGLVCASFVAYYISNYLPNVEGVDTSNIVNKVQELSGGNMRAVSNWRAGLNALAQDPNSGVTKYTNAATAYANLVPGDVIAFRNSSGEWPHVGIYAGAYSFLRSDGTNLGTYHFLIHVGNDRGPEISTVEYMAQTTGDKASTAAEWYHLEINTEEQPGYGRIKKETNTGSNLGGWKINLYTDAGCTQLAEGSPFTLPSSGVLDVELAPGDYWCREVPMDDPFWKCDTSIQKLTIVSGETSTVTFKNTHYGRGRIVKSMPDGGSAEGWSFDVYHKSDNDFVGTYTSGADGSVLTAYLMPGEYVIYENIPENSYYYCESSNPQTVTVKAGEITEVTFTNRVRTGRIDVLKVDTTNTPRARAEFLLEWSEDGITWAPVTYVESVVKGGCTSAGLTDGRLTSGSDGMTAFEGLHPELYYRLSETKAPDGLQLLTGYAYEGKLPPDRDWSVSVRVVNAHIFNLPETGGNAFGYLPVIMLLCCGLCAVVLVGASRRKKV